MIKILKTGKIPIDKYQQICNKCKTEFEANEEDIQNSSLEHRLRYVICPLCLDRVHPRLVLPESDHKTRTLEEEFDAGCR